jgi:hypothetical protein
MLFVCVFHIFPGNSDAFTSFLLGDPQGCELRDRRGRGPTGALAWRFLKISTHFQLDLRAI